MNCFNMDSNGQTLHDKPHTCMLCDIYGNAMLYFYYVIVTFFFHGGKMCRIFSIPWGGTIYGTIFHPVGWTKSGTFSTPRGQKSFCAGFFPSSGVENVPDFFHPVGATVNVTVKSKILYMLLPNEKLCILLLDQ